MAVELKVEDKIDYKRLRAVANGSRSIHVGHKGEKAEIAKVLYFGSVEIYGGPAPAYDSKHGHGEMPPRYIPPRPYLTDGFLFDESLVTKGVKAYFKGLFVGRDGLAAQALGNDIKNNIINFVGTNPYASSKPNASTGEWDDRGVIGDKGKNHPLVDSGDLMKSMASWVVKDE